MHNDKDEEKQTSKRKTLHDYKESEQGDQSWIKEDGTEATEDSKHSNYCFLCSLQIHHLRQSGAVLQEFFRNWVSYIGIPTAKKLDGMSSLETESPANFI